MARIDIRFDGFRGLENHITVNGKSPKLTRTQNGSYVCSAEAQDGAFDVSIYKGHYYTGKAWFWWNLLYFIVSVFGIFDIKQDKRCMVVDGRFRIIAEKDSYAIISKQKFVDGYELELAQVETNGQLETVSNVQYSDSEGKRRRSIMKKCKAGLIFLTILAVGILIVLL